MFHETRIRYFHEAVTCGSVRAAADKLGIAPSAISRQISLLEEELNAVLLERHRKGVVPTQAGHLLLDYHRQQVAHCHDVQAKIDALQGLKSGSVSIACGEGFAQEIITGPIRQFRQQYPGVALALDVAGTAEIIRRVREDVAELGLVYYAPAEPGISSRGSVRQPVQAIVYPEHPLRDAQSTTLAELSAWPLALLHGAYGIRQLIEQAERIEKIRLQPALTTNLISALLGFVASGQGVTLLPPCAVASELAQQRVYAVAVQNTALQHVDIQLITRTGRQLSPAANRFLQYCLQGLQAFSAPQ